MLKKIGVKYVIIGHSENRSLGETNSIINKKIKSSIKNTLKVIFCFGETLKQKRKKLTQKILSQQINAAFKNIKNANNVLFAYEPVWSIGTGVVPRNNDLEKNVRFIKRTWISNLIEMERDIHFLSGDNKHLIILE
jgi:triosephosphate isomerase